jgi:hypothetical protein
VLVLASACTHGQSKDSNGENPPRPETTTPTQHAVALCAAALGKQPFSADATTVGGLRTTTIGTRPPSQATMYPEFSDAAFAAWCWFGHGTYDVYEVTSDATPHQVASDYSVPASEAHGAPAIP